MRKYIENLTDALIHKNYLDRVFELMIGIRETFLKQVSVELLVGDVAKMNPETLGKIIASFETGDVPLSHQEIFENARFSGDCEDFLRRVASLFLAAVIFERLELDEFRNPEIPAYRRR